MCSQVKNFFISRVEPLKELPSAVCESVACILKTTAVVGAMALNILTFERIKKLQEFQKDVSLGRADRILTSPFIAGMKVINPKFHFDKGACMEDYNLPSSGLIMMKISDFFRVKSNVVIEDKTSSSFKKHIVTRGGGALVAIVTPIVLIAELALGLSGAALSVITLGTIEKVNTFAVKNLQVLGTVILPLIGIEAFLFGPDMWLFNQDD